MAYTTINKSSDYFNTKLYTGTGSQQTISGVGFESDFSWIKLRDQNTANHELFDTIRGATKYLNSNLNVAEQTDAQKIQSWNADGFVIGTNGNVNQNTANFASWNWLANGAGSANTDGSISSTVSANTTSGFSIVSYTGNGVAGATIGHGLGSAPSAIFVKGLSALSNWSSYHSVLGNTGYMRLDGTGAFTTASTYWNNTSPDNNVFTVGTTGNINASGNDFVAYCFAEKTGYSKFGSYVGNGNADGTFAYLGFKPAMVIVKPAIGVTNGWYIFDNKRDTYNPERNALFPNENNTETDYTSSLDFLSNGFKCRTTSSGQNYSVGTYIYMAFAEAPLVGSNNVPCTAR